jgi:hypothetical protein
MFIVFSHILVLFSKMGLYRAFLRLNSCVLLMFLEFLFFVGRLGVWIMVRGEGGLCG